MRKALEILPSLIDKVFPLPSRFRAALPRDVAELSRLLTSGREDRSGSYLGKPALLSAYLRFFLPWNIYRLSRLFSFLPLELKAGDAINDFGSGPLTMAASLWISRSDLRGIPLEFRCIDKTAAVLEAGKKFFDALTAALPPAGKEAIDKEAACPWTIRTIRGELQARANRNKGPKKSGGLSVEIRGKSAALSTAINIYNEIFWNFSPFDTEGLELFAENQARLLSALTEISGSVLVVEPGIPRSGEFISLLRDALIREGRAPISPCPHRGRCPFPGSGKAKWCHFAFDTEDAPKELHKLSAAARIPKERAVLSFLLAGPAAPSILNSKGPIKTRVISDSFRLGADGGNKSASDLWGRYGCSERGLVLVTGSRENLEKTQSGALEEFIFNGKIDAKSGAYMAEKKRQGV